VEIVLHPWSMKHPVQVLEILVVIPIFMSACVKQEVTDAIAE
jgi:hypothetical protein